MFDIMRPRRATRRPRVLSGNRRPDSNIPERRRIPPDTDAILRRRDVRHVATPLAGIVEQVVQGAVVNVIVDTREQQPFAFDGDTYADTTVEKGTLTVGDYSLAGLTELVAIERKSLPDLVMCLGRERDRFKNELLRGRALQFFAVVCEGSWKQLSTGDYRSQLKPKSAVQSVAAFMARYNIPFFFAESRRAAEYITWSWLKQFAQGKRNECDAILAAME